MKIKRKIKTKKKRKKIKERPKEVEAGKERNLGGRPMKFKSVAELEKKCEDYFESCYENYTVKMADGKKKMKNGKYRKKYKEVERQRLIRPLTITGLALALGTNRQTLLEYQGEVAGREKSDPRYADTIKKAKLICENFAEEYLYSGRAPVGAIFNLKNNYNWKEETQVEHKGGISLSGLFDKAKEK